MINDLKYSGRVLVKNRDLILVAENAEQRDDLDLLAKAMGWSGIPEKYMEMYPITLIVNTRCGRFTGGNA